ncbi:hypothetical protein [Aestuariivirga sp.]|uniref:hypothetical protein n=1 Tax=Aestuariivirga sp. TaxID=2650926 RepID=UPI0039E59ED4
MIEWAKRENNFVPDLIADIYLYPSHLSSRKTPIPPGYGCPLTTGNQPPFQGWDVRFFLAGQSMALGSRRRLGMIFLSREGFQEITAAQNFFLWEAGIIGEGVVVSIAPQR